MTVTLTALTSANVDSTGSTVTTASVSPAPFALVLVAVLLHRFDASSPTVSSLSGNGLTWAQVGQSAAWASSTKRLSLWRGQGAAPTSGAITITPNAAADSLSYSVVSFSGTRFGGNGSVAVLQSVVGTETSSTPTTITLSSTFPLGLADSATYGTFAQNTASGFTPGSGFTEIHDVASGATGSQLETEWKNTFDSSVDSNGNNGVLQLGIAVEIGSFVVPRRSLVLPQAVNRGATY